jgi:formamidopyrimidine-DNA glycosylase
MEKDVVGLKIKDVEVKPSQNAKRVIRRHKTRKEFTDALAGRKITRIERRGKYLLCYLDSEDVLVVHFGMSGQLLRGTKRQPMPPHTHIVFNFQQKGDLRYVDPRTFGELFVSKADDLGKVKELAHIAIDPLENTFTWQAFGEALAVKESKLKLLLMDQKFLSGLGNIYSDEVLFAAGLRYDRMSNSLSSQEVRRLYRAMQEIVQDAIRYRGTTLDDMAYLDLFGEPGQYQQELKVYGRAGLPCRRCRSPIEMVKVSQRSAFLCAQCQS